MNDRIRVAVIDDHPLFREGVAHTIRSSKSLEVVAEGACADDAIRIVKDQLPDIVLLDVSMPGGGIEAARTISRVCPVVKTIMLTVSESEEARRAGAGCWSARLCAEGHERARADQHHACGLSRGESYVSPAWPPAIDDRQASANGGRPGQRSSGADQARGRHPRSCRPRHDQKEIAKTLSISEKTVKHYMTNIHAGTARAQSRGSRAGLPEKKHRASPLDRDRS
jgi:DNA-binding NarL/FixJ family response regulator